MDRPRRRPSEFDLSAGGNLAPGFFSPQLDGLRCCAALLVLVSHAPTLPSTIFAAIQANGRVGVDLFLCISAFLITRLVLIEQERTGAFSLKAFFIRRALRIWPLYLGFATIACIWSGAAGKVSVVTAFAWWLSHISFTANLMTAIHGWSPVLYTGHLWTIALEEQAYLVLPLLLVVLIACRARTRTILTVSAAILAVLTVARLAFYLAGASPEFIYSLPLRSDPFVFGVMAAIALHRGVVEPRPWMLAAGVLTLSLTALFPQFDERSWYQVAGYTITALGSVGIVLGSQADAFDEGWLAGRPMQYLGKISYGIYVVHVAAIAVAVKLGSWWFPSRPVELLLALLITIGAASASYHFFEMPFLKLKSRFQRVSSRPI